MKVKCELYTLHKFFIEYYENKYQKIEPFFVYLIFVCFNSEYYFCSYQQNCLPNQIYFQIEVIPYCSILVMNLYTIYKLWESSQFRARFRIRSRPQQPDEPINNENVSISLENLRELPPRNELASASTSSPETDR